MKKIFYLPLLFLIISCLSDSACDFPVKVQSASPGIQGFDTDTPLNAKTSKKIYKDGYRFCIRYLSLTIPQEPGDLSRDETLFILQSGLALMAVQHAPPKKWFPTAEHGKIHGTHAALNARETGFPHGVNIWCDLEGVNPNAEADDVIAYCNNWYDAVAKAGYIPGLYVGYDVILNGTQLYRDLKFKHYWKSASDVPEIKDGYQLIQFDPDTAANGMKIDQDITQESVRGEKVKWLIKAPQTAKKRK